MEALIPKRKVVFLDRDGVLCEYDEFITGLEKFKLLPGIGPAVRKLNDAGYFVSLATNQPLVARGRLSVDDLDEMHRLLVVELSKSGAHVDFIAYCPHDPGPAKPGYVAEFVKPCDCRKPGIGMVTQAVEHFVRHGFEIDLSKSWMVGDSWRDLMMAQNAGLRAIAIVGAPSREHADLKTAPVFDAPDLGQVVDQLLIIDS